MANSNVIERKSCQSRPKTNNNNNKSDSNSNSNTTNINVSNIRADGKSNFHSSLPSLSRDIEGKFAISHNNEKQRQSNDVCDRNEQCIAGKDCDDAAGAQSKCIESEAGKYGAVVAAEKDIFDFEASEAAPPALLGAKNSGLRVTGETRYHDKRCDKSIEVGENGGGAARTGGQVPPNVINIERKQQKQRYRCGLNSTSIKGIISWNEWSNNAAYCYS